LETCHGARKQYLLYTDANAEKAPLQYSLYRYPLRMAFPRPFLVGAGHVSTDEMRAGSTSLSKAWGGELIEFSSIENPREVLEHLPFGGGLVRLIGDAAMQHPRTGSWLEALGAWRQPVILFVVPTQSGQIPGAAFAYVALCKSLRVPLLGLVQVGGSWEPLQRRSEGLPWCGWIPCKVQSELFDEDYSHADNINVEEIVGIFQKRIKEFDL
tara:strand:- start:227 stop:862 length:636 start_codon:yes stop_codon:yes gene_type:complete